MDNATDKMEIDYEQAKQEFMSLFTQFILPRPGADKLLEWLTKSDFFTAPASSRFHLCVPGDPQLERVSPAAEFGGA